MRSDPFVLCKFTGKELDSTGLYFYGARYYDPEIGRFITADTIVQDPFNPQTLNRYTYCNNNPINYVDPSGHFWGLVAAIFAAISITTTVAGLVCSATGNDSLARIFFQISQYSGYISAAIAAVTFVSAAIAAATPQTVSVNSLISHLGEPAGTIDLGKLVITPNKSMVVAAAWEATKDTVVPGIAGAISALGSQALNFVIDIPTISGGIALIKGADYNTVRGWFEGAVGVIGVAATVADAGFNVISFGARGAIEQAGKTVAKKIVIGEGSERVMKKALAIGAEHYVPRNPLPKNATPANIKRVMKSNYQWLKTKLEEGCEIVDIGLDPNRVGERGIFYQAEKRWLELWGKP